MGNGVDAVVNGYLERIAKVIVINKLKEQRKPSHMHEPYYNQKRLKVKVLNLLVEVFLMNFNSNYYNIILYYDDSLNSYVGAYYYSIPMIQMQDY
jgi:hypothetical protein